jgi:hypothetical protein
MRQSRSRRLNNHLGPPPKFHGTRDILPTTNRVGIVAFADGGARGSVVYLLVGSDDVGEVVERGGDA